MGRKKSDGEGKKGRMKGFKGKSGDIWPHLKLRPLWLVLDISQIDQRSRTRMLY